MRDAAVENGSRIVGFEPDHCVVVCDRAFVVMLSGARGAAVQKRIAKVRLESDGSVEIRKRMLGIATAQKECSATVVCLRKVGPEADRCAVVGNREIRGSLIAIGVAAVEIDRA